MSGIVGIVQYLTKSTRQLAVKQRLYAGARYYCKKADLEESTDPVKFSTSKAAKWKAIEARIGPQYTYEWPSYQNYVLSGCLAVFMIYFCVLREESDIDAELNKSLFDRVDGLEKQTIEQRIKYNEEHGLDKSDLEKRLRELQQESMPRKL